jgi:hypothetical protein
MSQNMIRVRNRHSATVAKITKGGEGYVPDSAALRAMVKGGLLEVLDGDLSGPAPAPEVPMGAKAADEAEKVVGTFVHESTMRRYAAEFDAAQAALREELDKVTADRNDLAARLEAAEKAAAGSAEEKPAPESSDAEKAPAKGKGKG